MVICFLLLCCANEFGWGAEPNSFLRRYCGDCHGPETQEGKFRVDTLTALLDANAPDEEAIVRWGRVVARLEAKEMPPRDQPRPSSEELAEFLLSTKTGLAQAAKARHAEGRVRVRRLNGLEYQNTVHDLLGIEVPLRDLLPEDELADGFSNATSSLSISPVHIHQYMAAADVALSEAIARQPRPAEITHRFSYGHDKEKPFYGHGSNSPLIRIRGDDLWFYRQTHIEVPAVLRQFAEVTYKTPGWFRINITVESRDTAGKGLACSVWTAYGGKRRELIGYYDVPEGKPTTVEINRWFAANETILVAPYRINQARTDSGLSFYAPQPDLPKGWQKDGKIYEPVGPALVVSPVEVVGPLHQTWPPLGHTRLFAKVPLVPVNKVPPPWKVPPHISRVMRNNLHLQDSVTPVSDRPVQDARRLLEQFLPLAFRRPVTEEDLEPYLAIARDRIKAQDCFEVAMFAAYRAVLVAPDFLFLVEEPGPLDDHALACRLSYFLWRSAPDKTLRAVADRGKLHQPATLRRETERLLASPRSSAFVRDFLGHWLKLREINDTMPDKILFPEYYEDVSNTTVDGLLHRSIVEETRACFTDLLHHDGSVLKLIDADYTFLNDRLARHYGLPEVTGVSLRRVALPPESQRGGLLTQASVLKVTANGTNTSPVVRGAWLLDNILGRPVPPPPPDAGSIEPDTRGATTIRQQLALHKSNESCAGCHRSIDPPGFALEAFDPVGRSREFYRATESGEKLKEKFFAGRGYRVVQYVRGLAVDFSGQLPDGRKFATPKQFKQLLSEEPDAITRCLASKLMTFATGQGTEPGDLLALDSIVANARKHHYGLRTLIHEIVQSEMFREK
jgi:hypothetical protein